MPLNKIVRKASSSAFSALLSLSAAAVSLPSITTQGAVPPRLEADFSEAVLAYNTRDFDGALRGLDALLRQEPKRREFLEMKALTLTSKRSYTAASAIYDQLIRDAGDGGRGRADVASYYFELGRIRYLEKKYDAAARYLKGAADFNFNVGAAHLFLGLVEFERKNFDEAGDWFQRVLRDGVEELKPTARVYLAQVSSVMSDANGAARNYVEARAEAVRQISDDGTPFRAKELAVQVVSSVDRGLREFDSSVFFASVGLTSGYDSNVLAIPTGSTASPDTGAGASSAQEILNFGLTYATSPVGKFQVVPSYKGSFNYNLNPNTKNAQFFTNDATIYLTKDPLSLTNWGFKVEGTGVMQYQLDPTSGSGKYGPYTLGGSFGPYAKFELTPSWVAGVDVYFQPSKYYLDSGLSSSLQRSGWDQLLRVFFTRADIRTYWNPGVAVTADYTRTAGEEFRSGRLAIDFANTFYFTRKLVAAAGVGAAGAWYDARPSGPRHDQIATVTLSGGYRFTRDLSVLLTLQYLNEFSNVSAYRYNRTIASAGATYLF